MRRLGTEFGIGTAESSVYCLYDVQGQSFHRAVTGALNDQVGDLLAEQLLSSVLRVLDDLWNLAQAAAHGGGLSDAWHTQNGATV